MRTVLLGTAGGLIGAILLTRLVGNLVYGVSVTDPGTFVGAAVVPISTAIVASLVPAWKASRIDRLIALRGE